ncbi:hypothetical protein [Altericista sp. CCNU0014]|uniref:hypothetical protein n=1 Tax=Altericista sp. CCNU0014 TaxID=3082949 RepID=UPI00384DC1BC
MSFDAANSPELPLRQSAAALMQPTFIRVMDHLRRMLEESDWKGHYETTYVWSENIAPETKAEVLWLYDKLEEAAKADRADIERQLEDLPQPIPVYLLHLEKGEKTRTMNLWELCYQICLGSYSPQIERADFVEIDLDTAPPDASLFDAFGEVDWMRLDQKAAGVIQAAFQLLKNTQID